MIELYTGIEKISKDARPADPSSGKKKNAFSGKTSSVDKENTEKIVGNKKKKFDKYDPLFDKEYANFHKNNKDDISKKEEELVKELNKKLPSYSPDTKIDDLEFIKEKLLKKEDLKDYFDQAKKNNYDLGSKIQKWSDRLLKLVLKQMDDINEDNDGENKNNGNTEEENKNKNDMEEDEN